VTTLQFPFDPPAPDGELKEVAPGIRWLRMPLPYALDHINLYLVRGTAGWTIVDTGINTPVTRTLWEKILADLDAPVVAVVCTHSHDDHAGLAGWLTETLRVPLYMSRAEYYSLRLWAAPTQPSWQQEQFYLRAGMGPEPLRELLDKLGRWSAVSPPPQAYRRLEEHAPLPLGDDDWQVVTGEGHSPEHACLFNAERQVLFSGDQLLARISPNVGVNASEPEANPLLAWLASLEKIGRLPESALVLPAHELPFYGLAVRAAELREHHQRVLDKLENFCRATPADSALGLAHQLFTRRRGPIDELLALSETIAHLSYLRYEGRIERELDAGGVYRFSLA
jgi:glyoxylase-like metal-dependent hydrolase (beta-lactamase superfamily II)